MDKELYIDGFGNIMVTGTMVRIDLVSLVEPGGEGRQPRFEHRQRLVLPLDGFLRSFGMAEDVVKKMIDAGVVATRKPNEQANVASVVAEDAATKKGKKGAADDAAGSPNFG